MNNNITNHEKIQYTDISKNNLFRRSALLRIFIGVSSTTFISFLFSMAHARWRNFHFSYVINWLKGSSIFSLLFYSGNEILYAGCNFFNIYTNFWLNGSFLALTLSKLHYKYLIRNKMMKWYVAIKYSHKCFLYFLVINLVFDLIIKLKREIYLFEEKDLFDILRENFKDSETNTPKFNLTCDDLEKHFMKPLHILNDTEKIKIIKYNLRHQNKDKKKGEISLANFFKVKTVNVFDLYKNNKV